MRRVLSAFFFLAALAWAVNLKLYLKDGSFQVVREYKVQSDRVRFYSVERSDWEEIPLDLVDLKRTQSEAKERQAEIEKDAKVLSDEDAAAKAIRKEVQRIPQDPGVHWIDGDQTRVIKAAESSVRTNKRREVLKVLSPIPAISGKATLELDGAHSLNIIKNPEQEFYIQLSDPERFGIAKLTPKGNVRIVENVTIQPITKDVEEDPQMVETLQQQLDANLLYKIWPKDPLPPGEYAVIEYTQGKLTMQVWDFAIKPAK
jgi:hypothetical protein